MSEILLEGDCSQQDEISQEDYYIFWLTNSGLEQLAVLLDAPPASSPTIDVRIGTGRLRFQIVSDGFVAETVGDKAISIQASRYELTGLARRLRAMAEVKPDPDYLVHIHMDNSFTSKAIGLSDIVFQRIDEYFPLESAKSP